MCARRIWIAKKMSKTPSKSHRLPENATNNQYEESKGGNCFLLSEPIDHFLHTKAPTAAALSSGCRSRLMDASQQEFVSFHFGLKAIQGSLCRPTEHLALNGKRGGVTRAEKLVLRRLIPSKWLQSKEYHSQVEKHLA